MIEALSGALSADTSTPAIGNSELGRDAFMKLLVAQISNQDPLEPTGQEQFISQLAQFSSLEEMQQVNENLLGLAVLQQGNALVQQLTDSSSLIGKNVTFIDEMSGETLSGNVDSVKVENGQAMLRVGGMDVLLLNVTEVAAPPAVDADDE